jgi:hypothetical protein
MIDVECTEKWTVCVYGRQLDPSHGLHLIREWRIAMMMPIKHVIMSEMPPTKILESGMNPIINSRRTFCMVLIRTGRTGTYIQDVAAYVPYVVGEARLCRLWRLGNNYESGKSRDSNYLYG